MFTYINFLEFKPLAIAEAALILSCAIQFPCFFKEICHCTYVANQYMRERSLKKKKGATKQQSLVRENLGPSDNHDSLLWLV
ncbi:unnamed protein product [Eruca vesicaria subsp. sativa]|uniref:Secreted protein n=1 Tax=Eruca vesicaria subsp. sativa TaxID=29727 RepID=A0ABC8L359_ERUVS|nr:unnamed protein product [Eruca vesicaria subsp. sativa]